MSRLAWLRMLALLFVGLVVGIAGAVLLNLNSVLLPQPTQTPEVVYVNIYPTPVPTIDSPLPDQCAETGGDYQVIYSEQTDSYVFETVSPDGKARVYADTQGVYLGRPDGTILTLFEKPSQYVHSYLAFWSPSSHYLVVSWTGEPPFYLMKADGSNKHEMSDVKSLMNFVSWSPDERFLALQDVYLGNVTIWTLDGQRTYTSGDERKLYVDLPPVWSPDSKSMLFQWRDNTNLSASGNAPYGFTIAPIDGSSSAEGTLTAAEELNAPFRVIPVWSPDSQYVALTYLQYVSDHYDETVTLYTRAGEHLGEKVSSIDGMVYSDLLMWRNDWNSIRWLGDILFYAFPVSKTQFTLLTFDMPARNFLTLYDNLLRPPFYQGDAGAVYKSDFQIDVFHEPFSLLSPGDSIRKLVTDATDAGDPNWSPGGEWVSAVWATGEKTSRRVFLSWMHSDGSGRQDIDADFRDVTELRWLKDSKQLAYIAWRGDAASIEIADTQTGARHTLTEGFSDIQRFSYDEAGNTLSFWWRMPDGSVGQTAYRTNGKFLYSIAYPTDLPLPRGEFWSPDGKTIAFKIASGSSLGTDEQLWLAYTDGRPPLKVRDHLKGLGDPFWSPDSHLIAFTQSRDQRPASLQIIDTSGVGLWDYAPFPIPRPIAWVKCE